MSCINLSNSCACTISVRELQGQMFRFSIGTWKQLTSDNATLTTINIMNDNKQQQPFVVFFFNLLLLPKP